MRIQSLIKNQKFSIIPLGIVFISNNTGIEDFSILQIVFSRYSFPTIYSTVSPAAENIPIQRAAENTPVPCKNKVCKSKAPARLYCTGT